MSYERRYQQIRWITATIVALLFVCVGSTVSLSSSPADFPSHTIVSIPPNTSLTETAVLLKEKHIIKSETVFKVATLFIGGRASVKSGDYLFEMPAGVWSVARRLVDGDQGLLRVKVTFPEGATVREMGAIIAKAIPGFDEKAFVTKALPYEGYLFPDTYFFFPNVTVDEIIRVARAEFDQNISALAARIKATGRTLADIVNMASILEKEATDDSSRRLISGILWKRLDSGMRLQVDAPFLYTDGKTSAQLTQKDLDTDSPYNTYRRDGLPKGPIANPGLDSIIASIEPMKSPYWFYLSDAKKTYHYARTFAEHVLNKQRYLR